MQKIIKFNKKVIVLCDNGNCIEAEDISDEIFEKVVAATTEQEILKLLVPSFNEIVEEHDNAKALLNKIKSSEILTLKRDSVYWQEVSDLSVPSELAEAIIAAEKSKDKVLLDTYKNFWTLVSLNPNEECRKNLFWFLSKWGLRIAKCGFFVAYRNANYVKTEKDGTEVYTDAHSGTTTIKIGEMTTLNRSKCDADSSHSCSKGLMCSPVYQ